MSGEIVHYARYPEHCTCELLVNVTQYWYQVIEHNPECPVHPDLDTLASEPLTE